ncbi:MAG: hypothetical protein LBQ83_03800 [Candidatus Margulisbacteria bacterium]|jgi:hypothetical protein|nr:hypothetical protein [Candidatus Margulisiibacteriota bacterium]
MAAKILQLIGQDRAVLYPAMIADFLTIWLAKFLQLNAAGSLPRYLLLLLLSALVGLFVNLFAAECARQIILRKKLLLNTALADTAGHYLPTLFFCGILAGLSAAVFLLLFTLAGDKLGHWLVFLVPLWLVLGFILKIFPIVYVLGAVPAYRVYYLIYMYLRKNFRRGLSAFSFFLLVTLLLNLAAVFLTRLPANFTAALAPLLSGFGAVFLVYGLVLFFLGDQQINELV